MLYLWLHDLNVHYYGKPMVNYNKRQTVIVMYCIKIRLLQFLQMLLFLLMNINVHLHPNSSYYYYCHLSYLLLPI